MKLTKVELHMYIHVDVDMKLTKVELHMYMYVDVHYTLLSPQDVKLTEATCQVILDKAGLTGWRLARSRVFLRYFHEQKLQLILKSMEDGAVLIQRIYRGHRARKRSVQH